MLTDIGNLKLWKIKFACHTEDGDSKDSRRNTHTQTDLCVFHKTSNTTLGNNRGRNNEADSNQIVNYRPRI